MFWGGKNVGKYHFENVMRMDLFCTLLQSIRVNNHVKDFSVKDEGKAMWH